MTVKDRMIPNRRLILPYAAPFLGYVFIASALGDLLSTEVNYSLRIVVSTALLVWAWKWYMPISGPKSIYFSTGVGVVVGVLGAVVWIALLAPFADTSVNEPWSAGAFVLRLLAASLLVPVFEEILMRGFIFRLAWQWWEAKKQKESEPLQVALDDKSVNDVPGGAWSWVAVLVSSLVFASGHHFYEWPAAIAFGVLMAMLWIICRDLLSCIIAHGITNLALAVFVLQSNRWYLW